MIRFTQFSLSRGVKPLFDKATCTINPGEKAGLIGANGAGKSTLFAVLRGLLQPDGGDVSVPAGWRIAHVAQDTPAVERIAVDYALDGDTVLAGIEQRMAAADASHDGLAIANAHAAFADADGYTARSRAEALLLGLGFTLAQTSQPVASFSGGWRMRLNLAQALMSRSDLLLLDEPTNHLDLDAIVWLEDWLKRYAGTLIVISHDREFLDAICGVTLHVEDRQIKRYGGNYSQFELLRAQQLTLQQSAYQKQQRNISHLQGFIDRFKAKASKARQAQSRVKALERLELLAPVHAASPFTFEFRTPAAAPNPMLILDDVRCGYRPGPPGQTQALHEAQQTHEGHGARDAHEGQPAQGGTGAAASTAGTAGAPIVIVDGVTISLQNGQRIGLLGANGQGKSTLIKTLAGQLAPLAGEVHSGKGLQIGYFAQHQLETLRLDDSPLAHLARIAPEAREQELRNFLGSFNFNGDMARSPITPFSGGEKARLALALIIWQKPNLLLLDEPTNHLDLETREALTIALTQFEGTLILVSHDRHLLRATTDQFMLVANHRLEPFDGDLDDYRDWLLQHAADKRAAAKGGSPVQPARTAAPVAAASGSASTDGNSAARKEQRRADAQSRAQLSNQRKPLRKKIDQLEREIDALNAEKSAVDAVVSDTASYEATAKPALTAALRRQGEIASRLSAAEAAWLNAQQELEEIG